MADGTAHHAMDPSMGQCWCPLRDRDRTGRPNSPFHDSLPATTPDAPKEPTLIGRIGNLLTGRGRRKHTDADTEGAPPCAGGETT